MFSPSSTADPWLIAAEELAPTPNPYVDDPARWVVERVREHPWSLQAEVMTAVRAERYVAVKSCHGIGKSWLASRLVCWWIDTHPVGSAFAVTTAPSGDQVKVILWREIGNAHERAGLGGKLNERDWKFGRRTVAIGRKPNDYSPTIFQGIHEQHLLIILDEACGIPKSLWDAARSLMTNADAHMLAIGNPDDPGSEFARCFRPDSGWATFTIPFDVTPNFTGEEVPTKVSAELISDIWVAEKRRDWGEGSPLWQSKVMAEFPTSTEESLVKYPWAVAAQLTELAGSPDATVVLAVDVARYGVDKTIISKRQGPRWRVLREVQGNDTTETAREVAALARAEGATEIRIDTIGVGAGVADQLRHEGFNVVDMVASARANEPEKFINARAEWFWNVRQIFEAGEIDIAPDDDTTVAQLTQLRYDIGSGKIKIESKDDIRKRGLPSPDRADALAMAFAPAAAQRFIVVASDDWHSEEGAEGAELCSGEAIIIASDDWPDTPEEEGALATEAGTASSDASEFDLEEFPAR